jgi:hypothetical protein
MTAATPSVTWPITHQLVNQKTNWLLANELPTEALAVPTAVIHGAAMQIGMAMPLAKHAPTATLKSQAWTALDPALLAVPRVC